MTGKPEPIAHVYHLHDLVSWLRNDAPEGIASEFEEFNRDGFNRETHRVELNDAESCNGLSATTILWLKNNLTDEFWVWCADVGRGE